MMTINKSQFLLRLPIFFIFLLTAACGSGIDPDQPPEIRYGEDICEECGMIISDPRFAAAYVTGDEQVRLFDDIGGMIAYDRRHQETVEAYWVHDLETKAWIRAEEAAFVLQQELITPMGWGLAAFADQTTAERFIEQEGGVMTSFAALRTAVETGVVDPGSLVDHVHPHPESDHVDEDQVEEDGNEQQHSEEMSGMGQDS